jgi:protein-disulfide isomerase
MIHRPLSVALLLIALLTALSASASAKGRGVREKVAWAELPATVQATIQANAAGGKVVAIEKRSRRGEVTYTAEVKAADGKIIEIEVASDGKLLGIEAGGDD